jgi:hypothetical protein
MTTVYSSGSNGTKRGDSSKPMFITGDRYYIIEKETRDKLLVIVGEEMKIAAQMAADTKELPHTREMAHKMAQCMIDLQAKLMYAEGGIAQWENDNLYLY